MKFTILFISYLQLIAVNQCSLLIDSEVALRKDGEYPGYITIEIFKENGEKIICGGILISKCAALTLAACFPNNNENYTTNVLSGQETCIKYEQKRSVRKVITNGVLAVVFTKGSFTLTKNTQEVSINTDKAQPEVVTAVGCPSSTGSISTANFYKVSEDACKNAFNDTTMDVKTECAKCPVEVSTCSAPMANPTFCKDNTTRSLAYRVQHPGCETGGIVNFIYLEQQLPFITSTVQNECCETFQPET